MTPEEKVCEHLRRYRITTPRLLLRHVFQGDQEAMQATLAALGSRISDPLPLGATGLCYLQMRDERPFSPPALVRAYGFLTFACRGKIPRQRLLREELPAPLRCPGQPAGDYFAQVDPATGGIVLGILYVDTGRAVRRLVRKSEEILRRSQRAGLDDKIAAGEFRLAVVTPDRATRGRLEHALQKRGFPMRFTVECLPELALLGGGEPGRGTVVQSDTPADRDSVPLR